MTAADVFSNMEARINEDPEKTKAEIDGIFKFVVTGDGGGTWIVDCKEVAVRNEDGEGEVTITISDDDLVAVADGSLDAMQAFMMGQIQVDGDVGLAMKLQQVL